MNSPQYEKLSSVYERLDSVYERLQNRRLKQAVTAADGYINDQMSKILTPVRNHLISYRDFHEQHTNAEGQVDQAQRDPFFDMMVEVEKNIDEFSYLVDSLMCRTGNSPGSQRRLSDLFQRVVMQERQELAQIRDDIRAIFHCDINELKRMPRGRMGLRLVASNVG